MKFFKYSYPSEQDDWGDDQDIDIIDDSPFPKRSYYLSKFSKHWLLVLSGLSVGVMFVIPTGTYMVTALGSLCIIFALWWFIMIIKTN